MRRRIFKFSVEGAGKFPIDMLRRNQCFPANHSDVENMLRDDKRAIELKGIEAPNCERWKSFGWVVLMSEKL